MAQKFRLIKRRNLGKDALALPEKYYAQSVSGGTVVFDDLCDEISEYSSLTSADVKATIDRLNYSVRQHLLAGQTVKVGDLGTFRLSVNSAGTATEEEFSTPVHLRRAKLIFTPSVKLKSIAGEVSFQRVIVPTVTAECNLPHQD